MPKRSSPPGDPSAQRKGPEESDFTVTLRATAPDRWRVDQLEVSGDLKPTRTVHNASRWWTQSSAGDVMTHTNTGPFGGAPDANGWASLLDPTRLVELGQVEALGPGSVDGRPTLRARVRPDGARAVRTVRPGAVFITGFAGDETLADLDEATGLVLRLESIIDGQPFRLFTMTDLVLDSPLDAAVFDEEPPADAPTRDAHQQSEPIETLAARTGFTLFVPEGAQCVGFMPKPDPDRSPVVHIHQMPKPVAFRPGGGPGSFPTMVQLTESSSGEGVADPSEWETVDIGGVPGWIWQPDGGGEVHVRLDRDGTRIWLRGPTDREEVLAIARSLAPVTPRSS